MKKYTLKLFLLLCLSYVCLFFSCGPAGEELEKSKGSKGGATEQDTLAVNEPAAVAGENSTHDTGSSTEGHISKSLKEGSQHQTTGVDSIQLIDSSSRLRSDRGPASIVDEQAEATSAKRMEGSVVYYCPQKMIEETENIVSVIITKEEMNKALASIKKRADEIASTSIIHSEIDFKGKSIVISKRMKVELICEEEHFKILSKPDYEDQYFNNRQDMSWDWIIIPQKINTLHLSFKISGYDSINERWVQAGLPEILNVSVQVSPKTYLARVWDFFKSKPEWLFTQLFFPIISFYFGKKKGEQSEK